MTEKMLILKGGKQLRLPKVMVAVGLAAAGFAVLWVGRKPAAQGLIEIVCSRHEVVCSAKIVRLDFGGLTLRSLTISETRDQAPIMSLDRLGIDVDWRSGPLALRPSWVGADGVRVRIDLRGGPLFGKATSLAQTFLKVPDEAGARKPPRVTLSDLQLEADTPLGLIKGAGEFVSVGPRLLEGRLVAQAVTLDDGQSRFVLSDGAVLVHRNGDDLSVDAGFHVDRLDMASVRSDKLELKVIARQDLLGLRASLTASAGEMSVNGVSLSDTRIRGEFDASRIDFAGLSPEMLLQGLGGVRLEGESGEGGVGAVSWDRSRLTLSLAGPADGRRSGALDLRLETVASSGLSLEEGALQGDISVSTVPRSLSSLRFDADGALRLSGLNAGSELEAGLRRMAAPIAAITAPGMDAALSGAAVTLIRNGRIDGRWSARLDESGLNATLKDPIRLSSPHPFSLDVAALDAPPVILKWRPSQGLSWGVASHVVTSGAGPRVDLRVRAEESPSRGMNAAIDATFEPWRIGRGLLGASLNDVRLAGADDAGAVTGGLELSYSGDLASGSVDEARLQTQLNVRWSGSDVVIDATSPPELSWKRFDLAEARFGEGSARFLVDGPLARKSDSIWAGDGRLMIAQMKAGVAGSAGVIAPGAATIDWTLSDTWDAHLSIEPSSLVFEGSSGALAADLPLLSGTARVGTQWSLDGSFAGGRVRAETLLADQLEGDFSLSGGKGGLAGGLRDARGVISDPSQGEDRVFETVGFSGTAGLSREVLEFSAMTRLAAPGLPLAMLTGRHDFRSGRGNAQIAPTSLQFRPRGLQPSDLSSRLRGPANVSGGVEVEGEASWSPDNFNVALTTDLQNVGFAIAAAGVFEDVSGRIEISDLFQMRSPPGQTIRIGKVTFGLPFEDGDIRFQLLDFDTIRLEAAQFPFAAGAIVIRPVDYRLGAERNLIVAEADRWDLTEVVRLFGVPDLQVEGVLSGTIPLAFSTGSARVEGALLEASGKGGVIRYTGRAGQTAGDADPNARLVFDALKDFRYSRLRVGLLGDITGRITLSLGLLGENPGALGGADFDLNIGVESELMNLLQSFQSGSGLSSVIRSGAPSASERPIRSQVD